MLRKSLTLALITLWIGTAVSINPPGLFIDKMYDQQVECGRGKECRNFPANCLDDDSCQGGFSIGPILGDPDKDEAADVTVFEIYFRRDAELTNDTYGAIKLLDEKTGENTYRICFPKRKAAFAASEDDNDNQILVVDTAKPLIYKETITGEGIVSCVFFEFSNPLEFSAARKTSEIVFGEMSDSVMSTDGSETTSRRQNMQIAGEGEVEEKDKVVVVTKVKKEKEQKVAVIEVPQEKETPVEEPQEIISTTEAIRVTKPTVKPTTIVPVKKETVPTKPAQTKTTTATPIPVKSTTGASSLAAMMANIEKEKKETELKEKKVVISETEFDEDVPSDEGDVDTVIDEVVEEELVEEIKVEKPTPKKERKRVEEADESDSDEKKDTVVDKKKTGKASDQETLDKIVEERIEKLKKKVELEQMKREQDKSKETPVTKKSPISHTKMDEGAIKRKQLERKVEMRALDDSEPVDDEMEEEDLKQDRALDIEIDEEVKDKIKKDGTLLKVSDKKVEKKSEVEEEKNSKKTTAKPDPKQKHPKDVRPKKDEDAESDEDNEDDDDAATHLSTMVGILVPFVVYMVL